MKPALCLLMLLAGCGGANEAPDNTRVVDRPALHSDIAPVYAVDEAVRSEAMVAARTLMGQMQAALIRTYGGDTAKLAADVQGQLTPAKLQKLGISEGELAGKHYRASDYQISFAGKQVTIEAGAAGTRGHIRETFNLR